MNPVSSPAAARSAAAPAAPPGAPAAAQASPAPREATQIALLIGGVVLAGSAAQLFVAPGPWALVASAGLAGAAVLALAFLVPGKLRQTMIGFRFVASLLVSLAVASILGTLILQGKAEAVYRQRYGAVGDLIVALRLDDIFHSVWFGGLVALLGASVVSSAILRWPVRLRGSGFFICHVGLITSLVGAGISSTMSLRGRVDLHAGGESAGAVAVTKGASAGRMVPLGFDLRLDRFDVIRYRAEYRVAFYAPQRVKVGDGVEERWRLEASFDPDLKKHRLPGGDSFRLKAIYPDFALRPHPAEAGPGDPAAGSRQAEYTSRSQAWRNPAVLLELTERGRSREALLSAQEGGALRLARAGALVFERREEEVKSFRSEVTALAGAASRKALITVNDPFAFQGWTFYQVNYDPRDPSYSGLEAVRDPGVTWVFLGFALISIGVAWMFYVEPRLRGGGIRRPAAPAGA